LSTAELEALRADIRSRPAAWMAQERLPLSTAPTYDGEGLQPRHVVLRAFLARRGDGYAVMPGALTRFASSHDSLVVSMQRGGGSKDTWVLSSDEPSNFTLLRPPGLRVEIVRSGADLPSRAADNLFWIGRHVERTDGTTRLLRSVLSRRVEDAESRAPEVSALLTALEDNLELPRGTLTRSGEGLDEELGQLLLAREPSRTPFSGIKQAYRAASVVRDRISVDAWRVLSHLDTEIERAARRQALEVSDALELSGVLLLAFSAFAGLVMENMTHGPGWRFADIGRRIERGTFMIRLLRSMLVSADHAGILDAVLDVADSAITYRSRYLGTLALEPVLDLLITDETNPRSIAYQLAALQEHVERLPRAERSPLLAPEAKTVLKALSTVRFADLDRLARADSLGRRSALDELLAELEETLPLLAEQLTLGYLAHARPSVFVSSSA
ncbi:MAG TPA: circularly permuted type 2 ATP-grasp protein, partial [Polyangiaceae bacterium]